MAVGQSSALLAQAGTSLFTPTNIMLAGKSFQATSQILGGQSKAKAIKREGEYNAQVYEQQAEMVVQKKKILEYQFNRQAGAMRGSMVAQTAGKGLALSGSPLAILIDNETQMQLDKNISDYNLDIERNYALSGANYYRESADSKARLAKYTGYSNAFSTILSGGAELALGRPTTGGYGKSGRTREERIMQMNAFKAGRYGRV